ncbi:phosphatase PAP2 family protein [Carboxylicivirga taeanensis]|uniref:phosphatase PAP2 family protein n=1 Tax=Carboxylicivirga taeanensis TaxID=1416875 RepID=UPI003F6E30C3
MKQRIRLLLSPSVICLLVLSSAFFLPFSFSAVDEQWKASFWLFISNSGGVVGVPLITIAFCVIISLHYQGLKNKLLTIVISLLVFSVVLGLFARLNEFFIKEQLRVERPNIKYLNQHMGFDSQTFYAFEEKEERQVFIEGFLANQPNRTITYNSKPVQPIVLEHWIDETGYSFPSGHSFNAFLLSTLMAYIILYIYSDFRRRMFFVLPLVWAVLVAFSRVNLGVHSPIDVNAGALLGSVIGYLVIVTGFIDRQLIQK